MPDFSFLIPAVNSLQLSNGKLHINFRQLPCCYFAYKKKNVSTKVCCFLIRSTHGPHAGVLEDRELEMVCCPY
jgi:hypothetical protein